AAVLAEGWPVDKPLEIERLPVADGGEGTAEAIHDALAGRWITLPSAIPSVGLRKAATPWLRKQQASSWQCWRCAAPPASAWCGEMTAICYVETPSGPASCSLMACERAERSGSLLALAAARPHRVPTTGLRGARSCQVTITRRDRAVPDVHAGRRR